MVEGGIETEKKAVGHDQRKKSINAGLATILCIMLTTASGIPQGWRIPDPVWQLSIP